MSYLPTFSQPTRWWLPPPSGLSWNIYGKFCLFVQTSEVSQFRPPSSPSPAFIFFIWHLSLCAQLTWTRAFLPCLLQTEMLTFSSIFTHRSSEIRIFCATNTIYILSRYCFIYTNVYETTQPTLQQMYVFLLRHLLFHFSHQLVTIPYTFRE